MAAQSVPRAFQAHIPPLLPSQRLLFQAVSISSSLSSRFKQRETAQTMVFAFFMGCCAHLGTTNAIVAGPCERLSEPRRLSHTFLGLHLTLVFGRISSVTNGAEIL